MSIDLIYFNPNPFSLQLKRTEIDVFINDIRIGNTSQDQAVSVPAQSEFSIPVNIDVDMKNLLVGGLSAALNKEVSMKLKGSVKVGRANFYITYPVDYTGKRILGWE